MKNIQPIIDKANHLGKFIDWKEFDNGTKRVVITAEFNSPEWDELIAIIHEVRENTYLGEDSAYQFTMEALGTIIDSEAKTEDELREVEIEADIYTSDLTEWLNESNYHVEYVTDVMREYSPENGFELLTLAQLRAMEETYRIVLDYLLK